MPTYILKVSPEKDLYIGWSSVTDSIHFWGTREEVIEREIDEAKRRADEIVRAARSEAEQRLDRADETGTSALWGNPPVYGFQSEGLVWQNSGVLPRERIEEMLGTYNDSIGDFEGEHLLKPFEDD